MSVKSAPLQIGLGSALIARQLGVQLTADRIEAAFEAGELSSPKAISSFFAKVGISVQFRSIRLRYLQKRTYLFPTVAILRNSRALVLAGVRTDDGDDGKQTIKLIALDPADASGRPMDMGVEDFRQAWSGRIALVTRISGEESKDRPFNWRWFLPEIGRFKWLLLLALMISLILHALAFAPIIFLQTALDKVIGYEATSTLFVLTAGVLLALLFTGILGYARDYIIRFVARAVEARLAGDAFDKLLDLPMQTFLGAESSSLEGGIQGVTSIRFFLVRQVLGGIFDLSALLVFLPILIAYSVPLGLLVIGFAVVMGGASLTFKLMERRLVRQTGGVERDRNLVLRDTIRGIDTVKTLSQESRQRREWRRTASATIRAHVRQERVSVAATQVNSVLQQVMTVAVIFIGVQLVFSGSMSAGSLIAVSMVGVRVVRPLVQAISGIAELERVRIAMTQIGHIWNARSERQGFGAQHVVRGAYELANVSVIFGNMRALDKVNLTIPARKKVAIVGPSAAGKTTLLRLLQGLVRATEGSFEVDGRPLTTLDLQNFRRQVALVNPQPTFFDGTVEENLRRAKPNVGERDLEEAFELSGFSTILPNLPEGLATNINHDASSLPATHRQLLALTRALLADPKVLLLDEIFSNLDKDAQLHLHHNLDNISEGRTLVVISHDLKFVTGFDQIVVMEGGRVVGQGSHHQLLTNCPTYQRLWAIEQNLLALGAVAK